MKKERTNESAEWKLTPRAVSYANGSQGSKVRMLLRCGYLPVRNNSIMDWKMEEKNMCVW